MDFRIYEAHIEPLSEMRGSRVDAVAEQAGLTAVEHEQLSLEVTCFQNLVGMSDRLVPDIWRDANAAPTLAAVTTTDTIGRLTVDLRTTFALTERTLQANMRSLYPCVFSEDTPPISMEPIYWLSSVVAAETPEKQQFPLRGLRASLGKNAVERGALAGEVASLAQEFDQTSVLSAAKRFVCKSVSSTRVLHVQSW